MKIANRVMAAVLGSALLLPALGACGADSGSGSGSSAKAAGAKSDALPTVKPDAAAVKLVPASLKKQGTLSMAADLHYPPRRSWPPTTRPRSGSTSTSPSCWATSSD